MLLQAFSHPLAIVVPLVIWGMLVAFVLSVFLALEDGLKRLRRLHQIPCHRCQYYTGSPYLKCPVHPVEALSEEAVDCTDYAYAAATHGFDQGHWFKRARQRLSRVAHPLGRSGNGPC